MAAEEHHFSPPEIPEPTLLENVLRYGLFFGALFQLLCVLAIILPVSKSPKASLPANRTLITAFGKPAKSLSLESHTDVNRNSAVTLEMIEEPFDEKDTDSVGSESKTLEAVKKPKAPSAAQLSKKSKKESKKKR